MILARGMQSFQIAAAKYINAAVSKQRGKRRKGRVFRDRYFRQTISNRRQARHALAYVLKNASHCTYSGRRVVFPLSCAESPLLRRAQRLLRYRRPSLEELVWDRPPMPLPGQVDFQIRYGPGVPEQLHS